MNKVDNFCAAVRKRSQENQKAMDLLEGLPGPRIAILRQELDSLLRVIHLNTLAADEKEILLEKFVTEDPISGKKPWPSDACMLKKAMEQKPKNGLANDWVEAVYKCGCVFVHLSTYWGYNPEDKLEYIRKENIKDIQAYLHYYHPQETIEEEPCFSDLVSFVPKIFQKISCKVEQCVKQIEK